VSARALRLLGRHYTSLGPLAVAELPDGGAVGLSRGLIHKAYRYVDPNEDGVLLLRSEHGVLLAVADGYNGTAASELALERVQAAGGELIQLAPDRFRPRMEQLALEISAELRGVEPSRSCLLVAVVVGRTCSWFCLGDSALYRSSRNVPATPSNDLVLEPRLRALPHPTEFWSGVDALDSGERIALVTDGVTNFVAEGSTIAGLLANAESDAHAVRSVAFAAMRGGAGDNISVATIRVT